MARGYTGRFLWVGLSIAGIDEAARYEGYPGTTARGRE